MIDGWATYVDEYGDANDCVGVKKGGASTQDVFLFNEELVVYVYDTKDVAKSRFLEVSRLYAGTLPFLPEVYFQNEVTGTVVMKKYQLDEFIEQRDAELSGLSLHMNKIMEEEFYRRELELENYWGSFSEMKKALNNRGHDESIDEIEKYINDRPEDETWVVFLLSFGIIFSILEEQRMIFDLASNNMQFNETVVLVDPIVTESILEEV